jgi:hypothetical protein
MATETKVCKRCGRSLPLNARYWRRDSSTRDKWARYCKECVQQIGRDHYIKYNVYELEYKGSVGVRCPLYAERCRTCSDVSTCWRIAKINPDSNRFPIDLREEE